MTLPPEYIEIDKGVFKYEALQFRIFIIIKEVNGTFEIKIGYQNHLKKRIRPIYCTFILTIHNLVPIKELQSKIDDVVKTYQLQEISQLRELFAGNKIILDQIDLLLVENMC